jgi:hypothetical protein
MIQCPIKALKKAIRNRLMINLKNMFLTQKLLLQIFYLYVDRECNYSFPIALSRFSAEMGNSVGELKFHCKACKFILNCSFRGEV